MLTSHPDRDLLLGVLQTIALNAFEGKRLWSQKKEGIIGFGYVLESALSDTSLSDFSRSSSQEQHGFMGQDRQPDLTEKRYLDNSLAD